ncbi:MAG: Uma2 family endonuclease [Actinomycetota bacterium]|nr:Uma2 family endonuclease [Actinomycetota bacterium]MDQ3575163.1 Uma2 family endonuclease [Actinomycetota bacterium]
MAVQPVRHRFTVGEYHQMAEGGVFTEDDRVELLEGEIVEMAPIGSRHAACVKRIASLFHHELGERATIGVQDPVRLSEHSEPQPDVMLLRPRADYYAGSHPDPGDVLLLVEVAETTAAWDREHKLPLYASAGVTEVWIVDLAAGAVEAFRRPQGGAYREVERVGSGESLAPRAFDDVALAVSDLLG